MSVSGDDWWNHYAVPGATMGGVNRRFPSAVIVASVMMVSACAPSHTRTHTAPGAALDCPNGTIETSLFGPNPEAPGSPTARDALVILSWDLGMPQHESKTDDAVAFVYRDADGDRRGRVVIARTDTGWFIQRAEWCT